MTKLMKVAGIAGLLMAAIVAASPSLFATELNTVRENQGVVTELGPNATAVSYWAAAPEGWQVVTTVSTVSGADTEAEQHAIVRFAATLAPGQEQVISIPSHVGAPADALRIRRVGDRIEIEHIPDPYF
jgi:hypothetical protein